MKGESMSKEPGITLSEDRGVNARMTICSRCGAETSALVLLGDSDYLFECASCHKTVLGKKGSYKCPSCGAKHALRRQRRLDEWEKVPYGLCDSCKAKDEECAEVVKQGGVYWRCQDCGSAGAIRAESELAKRVRETYGIEAPKPVGIEFTKNDGCPVCGQKEEKA